MLLRIHAWDFPLISLCMNKMKLMKPEVGGPYRKIPTFEQMIDVPQKKIPDIDRSGLVAIDSYELGYLRDSLGELSQHQLENEAHEEVRRHARQLAEQTGVPARELVEGTRIIRRQQQMTQFFNLQTPRGSQSNQSLSLPSDRLTGSHSITNPVGSPLDQLVADREAAQAQRILDVQFHEAEQRASIERSTEIARSRLDEFAEHGAIGHTRSALWHAAALATHGTAASLQTLGNVAGAVDTGMNALTQIPHPISASLTIMNQLASVAVSGTGTALSGGGQVLSAAGSATGQATRATMRATGAVYGAMREQASSSSGRWERRAAGIYDRVVDPLVRATVDTAL